MTRWIAGRWEVELIDLDGCETLRVRQGNAVRGYVHGTGELAALLARYGVTVGELEEVDEECE